MICKNELTNEYYDYKFIEDGIVELTRPDCEDPVLVKYEDWCFDYCIIDIYHSLNDKWSKWHFS